MTVEAKTILREALTLPAPQRAELAEELLTSIQQPDPSIDRLWAEEAEVRLAAFEAGQIEAVSAEEVFAEFEH